MAVTVPMWYALWFRMRAKGVAERMKDSEFDSVIILVSKMGINYETRMLHKKIVNTFNVRRGNRTIIKNKLKNINWPMALV